MISKCRAINFLALTIRRQGLGSRLCYFLQATSYRTPKSFSHATLTYVDTTNQASSLAPHRVRYAQDDTLLAMNLNSSASPFVITPSFTYTDKDDASQTYLANRVGFRELEAQFFNNINLRPNEDTLWSIDWRNDRFNDLCLRWHNDSRISYHNYRHVVYMHMSVYPVGTHSCSSTCD